MARRTNRTAASALATASGVILAGCATAVPVDAAPYASDPDCARVMLAAPDTVGGLTMRKTTSQATSAYGDEFVITVRCGVEPPGPSQVPCVEVSTGGTTLGWLVTDTDDAWVAVSFGRSPAVEVTIPHVRADQAVGDLLAELAPSAALAPANGLECR